MAKKRLFLSEAEIVRRIKSILVAIRSPEHAEDVIELQKIYKKNVPLFDRSYFATFLLKEALKTGNHFDTRLLNDRSTSSRGDSVREEGSESLVSQKKRNGRDRDRLGNRKETEEQSQNTRLQGQSRENREQKNRDHKAEIKKDDNRSQQTRNMPLPEGVEAATLFVSAGRKRHFYPRHFLDILDEKSIPRDAVGEIRLFDNYTFVQVRAEAASEMVEKLDGVTFKGRRLTVNPARKREEDADRSEKSTDSVKNLENGDYQLSPQQDEDAPFSSDSSDSSILDSPETALPSDESDADGTRPAGLGTGGYETDYASEDEDFNDDIDEDFSEPHGEDEEEGQPSY